MSYYKVFVFTNDASWLDKAMNDKSRPRAIDLAVNGTSSIVNGLQADIIGEWDRMIAQLANARCCVTFQPISDVTTLKRN